MAPFTKGAGQIISLGGIRLLHDAGDPRPRALARGTPAAAGGRRLRGYLITAPSAGTPRRADSIK